MRARRRRRGWSRGMDLLVIGPALGLSVIGALSVYAATHDWLVADGRDPSTYLRRELVNIVIGVGLAAVATRADHRQLRAVTPALYAGVCLALLVVLSPLGTAVNGSHGWFSFGPLQLEPSEFAKLALILVFAGMLAEPGEKPSGPTGRDLLVGFALVGIPLLLILAEPALGVAIVVIVVVLALVAASGAPARWVAGLVLAVVLTGAAGLSLHLVQPYQQARLTAFANPRADHTGVGYQTLQSQVAIGSGGLVGKGFLQGGLTNGRYVPEQQTDFVFTVVGEEAGFVGCSVVLALVGTLVLRALSIARRARDPFGRLVAVGVAIWIAVQAFINIGMTVGIMPVTGIPLPFVSYGGSAIFANMLAVGLLLAVHRTEAATDGPAGARARP